MNSRGILKSGHLQFDVRRLDGIGFSPATEEKVEVGHRVRYVARKRESRWLPRNGISLSRPCLWDAPHAAFAAHAGAGKLQAGLRANP